MNDKLLSIFAVNEHAPAYIFSSIGKEDYYCTSGTSHVRLSINNTEYKKLNIQVDGLKMLHESNDNYVRQKALTKVEEFHHGEKPRLRRPQTIAVKSSKNVKVNSQSQIFQLRRAVLFDSVEKTNLRQYSNESVGKVNDELASSFEDRLVELYFSSRQSLSKDTAQLFEARIGKRLGQLHYASDHWFTVKVLAKVPQLAPKKTFPEKSLAERVDTSSPANEPKTPTPLPSAAQKGQKKTRLESTQQALKQKNIRAISESPAIPSPIPVEPRSLSSQSLRPEKTARKTVPKQAQPQDSFGRIATLEKNGNTVKARKVEDSPLGSQQATMFFTLYDQYKTIHTDLCTDKLASKVEKRAQLQKLVDLHNQLGKLKSQLWKHSFEDAKAS